MCVIKELSGNFDIVPLGHNDGVQSRMEHFCMIHCALLPVHTVSVTLKANLFFKPLEGKPCRLFVFKIEGSQEKAMILQYTPVGQPVVGCMGLFEVVSVGNDESSQFGKGLFIQGVCGIEEVEAGK